MQFNEIEITINNRSIYTYMRIIPFNKGPDALDWQNLFGSTKNLDKFCLCQIFNLSILGALKNSKIFVIHKVPITWKLFTKYLYSSGSKESYFAACFLGPFPLSPALEFSSWLLSIWSAPYYIVHVLGRFAYGCVFWSVCTGMYKLNSTWTWRYSWNVNLGTIIVVFWVMIVMQHPEVRIFHLHRLIAA